MLNYRYDHIHLFSPDPLEAAKFYERMFNAKVVNTAKLSGGRTSVELSINGMTIIIVNPQAPPEPASTPPGTGYGLMHFGLKTDNIEAAVADLKAKGVKFRDEIREVRPGFKICFLWAPDNVLIELLERG